MSRAFEYNYTISSKDRFALPSDNGRNRHPKRSVRPERSEGSMLPFDVFTGLLAC